MFCCLGYSDCYWRRFAHVRHLQQKAKRGGRYHKRRIIRTCALRIVLRRWVWAEHHQIDRVISQSRAASLGLGVIAAWRYA
ncbi:hypothetical protein CEXT_605271 [Caerostris extrusa]|uniref:Uncharacterized protein n=1 Tax=Caerostris extrusa TaxID=172846 RepID=A0AAV4PZQ0_CAEEX|nr:hypothetical protein CEXT_605271 [Caerostris extrusa]